VNVCSSRPAPEAGLRDVDEQARDLGLARQLPQHRAEVALDFGELAPRRQSKFAALRCRSSNCAA
jgi:hypothetical protein